jgi:16S rRNA (guanine1207-N2)-methyltransferase
MTPRLSHALDSGALALPPGRIAVFAPRAGTVLPWPPQAVQIVTWFRPDHDWFAARGFDCRLAPAGDFAAALVVPPRSRDAARGLVAEAAALVPGRTVVIDGARTEGIDPLWRELRDRAGARSLAKAHGRVIWFTAAEAFPDWAAAARPRRIDGWTIRPGAFSAEGPDPGSQALLAALPPLAGRVADLGAGWGFLAAGVLAASPGVTELHLVEADARALDCARANVPDPRARFHWADALAPLPGTPFDAVVTNPPFHTTRAADPGLGRGFIAAAARALGPQGSLWLVANRHLPYDSALTDSFAEVEERPGTAAFKVFRARRPRRS